MIGSNVYSVQKSTLRGEVTVSGAKNSVLRLMAASILTRSELILTNYPQTLLDAQIHEGMLRALGKTCVVEDNDVLRISECTSLSSTLVWTERSIRNTLLILGALTARTGFGAVPLPGGCSIGDSASGERAYDLHILVLERLGARVFEKDGQLCAEAPTGGLIGNDIELPIRSTGATENAILCSTLAKGRTRIWNPHIRVEIIDMIQMLQNMGAKITVYGQEYIEIEGQEELSGIRHDIMPDNMEALTWLIASVMTGGDVEINRFPLQHLEVPLIFLRESGARYYAGTDRLIVRGGRCFPLEISTGPYPGINSDMQPLFAAYGARSRGETRIVDLRFPGRYSYAQEFERMGVRCRADKNTLFLQGSGAIQGCRVTARDLRAGVALTLLGLVADGTTTIHDAWQVERGYDRFVTKLQSLGGNISAT